MVNEARWPKIVGRPQESVNGYNHIHCLCDELLTEILLRLPNCKSILQCKCVCKHWAALASHPRFIAQFIGLKLGHGVHGTSNGGIDLNKEHETFATVMRYKPDCAFLTRCEISFKPSIFHGRDSTFSPLDGLEDDNALLVASCRDLLLYCRHEGDKYHDYYISNVQTRQWVKLPSPPYSLGKVLVDGFICDPFHSCDGEILVNYHYSVVVVCCLPWSSTKLRAHLFSSHCDTQWCERVLTLPKPCRVLPPGPSFGFPFCFNGKLHFTCLQGFFGFDHNSSIIECDGDIQCHLVRWPVGLLLVNLRVGVSQGNLHVSNFDFETCTLNIWTLKDYKAGIWMLQRRVELSEWVSRESWMTKELQKFRGSQGKYYPQLLVNVLSFHPITCDVIYLLVPGCIFVCNLSTKAVELACRIPVVKWGKYYLSNFYTFPVIFQSWPTPLPQGFFGGVNTTPASCSGHQQ